MIATQNNGAQVESTLTTAQKVDMGIDPGAFAHIMSILTDLYSNRIGAVIREYSTNAWDAQREVGVTRPIEVTLPTRFAPHLVIRDFGVGLSVQDIHDIYSQYGASTKRGTNDQVGMLGLGCKSALTYTTQFTVTSIQSGTKVQVIVARDEDGTGSMHIADTSTTTEPNGTAISVPVMAGDIDRFRSEAESFFAYWPKGHVLVNGQQPASVMDDAMKVTDSIFIVKDGNVYGESKHMVVMGNVAYPAPNLDVQIPPGHSIVAFTPIGSVNFAPSREALMDTSTTTATLDRIADEYAKGIVGVVEREVKNAPSHAEARRKRYEWDAFIDSSSVITYKGEAIPARLDHPQIAAQGTSYPRLDVIQTPKPEDKPYTLRSSYYKVKTEARWRIEAEVWDNYLWVHGWDYAKLSRTQAAKLDKYVADKQLRTHSGRTLIAVLHPSKWPHSKWLDPKMVVDWSVIDAIKLPSNSVQGGVYGGRKTGSFDCYVNGDWKAEVDANDIDVKHPVYFYAGPNGYGATSLYNRLLRALGGKFTIVTMPSNRKDKFCREFTSAVAVSGAVRGLYDAWVKGLSKDQQRAMAMHDAGDNRQFENLNATLVNDPDLKNAIRLAQIDLTKVYEQRKLFENALPWGTVKRDGSYTSPLKKYPLFNASVARTDPTHTYWYLNAAFAANV